jgi:hypothetical protein
MTEAEIKIADWIIRRYKMSPTGFGELRTSDDRRIATYLADEGLIVLLNSGMIALTPKGEQFQKSGKSYADYLEEKKKKSERDDKHKELQIQDLETKIKVMNEAQLDFWKSQKQKNVQTTIIAIISALFALIAMMKSFGIL